MHSRQQEWWQWPEILLFNVNSYCSVYLNSLNILNYFENHIECTQEIHLKTVISWALLSDIVKAFYPIFCGKNPLKIVYCLKQTCKIKGKLKILSIKEHDPFLFLLICIEDLYLNFPSCLSPISHTLLEQTQHLQKEYHTVPVKKRKRHLMHTKKPQQNRITSLHDSFIY